MVLHYQICHQLLSLCSLKCYWIYLDIPPGGGEFWIIIFLNSIQYVKFIYVKQLRTMKHAKKSNHPLIETADLDKEKATSSLVQVKHVSKRELMKDLKHSLVKEQDAGVRIMGTMAQYTSGV